MPDVTVAPSGVHQFFDDSGDPLAAGKLYTYAAGTSTPQATYTDYTGTVAAANPIILDSAGRATFFLTVGQAYKFKLDNSSDSTIWTVDGINYSGASGQIYSAGDGSVGAPAYGFVNDPDCGWYRISSDTIGVATAGAEAARIDSSQNVGIGVSPTTKLDVNGTAKFRGATTITTGGLTVSSGNIAVSSGSLTVSSGLTVSASGAAITGTTTIAGATTISAGVFTTRGFVDNATSAAFNIDSSGRMLNNGTTMPGFTASRSGNIVVSTGSALIFDTETRDVGTCYNNTNGRFTAPVAGCYVIAANVSHQTGAAANGNVALRLNGSSNIALTSWRNETGTITSGSSPIIVYQLAANDYIDVVVTSDASTTYMAGSTFSAQLLY